MRTVPAAVFAPVEVVFSTWSVALLQYVTDTLLADKVPGLASRFFAAV